MPNVYIYIYYNTLYTSLYNICIFYNSNTFGTVLHWAHQSILGELNVDVESLWFSRSDNLQMVDFSRRCKRLSTWYSKTKTPKQYYCSFAKHKGLGLPFLYMGMSQNTVSNPGSLTRGYDSWVWFGVWFVGMIRGPWFSVSLRPPRIVICPHLPWKCFNCWWLYHTWSALELACCWRCACCCQSGVRALERASWCRWSAAARCWCRVWLAVRVVCTLWSDAGDVWRCCCQSGVCCKPCFGAGMLVSGCRWKVLLEGAVELACWCCCKGWCTQLVLQGC